MNYSIMTTMSASTATIIGMIIEILLEIIAWWKIFTKAGEAGWKSIIPFYSQYTQFKIAWKPAMFWAVLIAGFIGGLLNQLSNGESIILAIIAIIVELIGTVLMIVFYYQLSKSFGKGAGFTVGLIFLRPIFLLILAFGGSEYQRRMSSYGSGM